MNWENKTSKGIKGVETSIKQVKGLSLNFELFNGVIGLRDQIAHFVTSLLLSSKRSLKNQMDVCNA